MGPDKYYISGLEGGAVANGDILNLSIDLLDDSDYWLRASNRIFPKWKPIESSA